MNCLFIGGSKDGQWMEIPYYLREVYVAIPPDLWKLPISAEAAPPDFSAPERQIYKRHKFSVSSSTESYRIFAHEDLSTKEIFEMLLQNYRPEHKS